MKRKQKLRLGLIYGGESAEREVSISTAGQIKQFLNKKKYQVIPIEISKTGQWPRAYNPSVLKQKIDLAFIAMHGTFGEDGTLQGMLEMLHIPYTFSGVLASALAMDKMHTQYVAEANGILMPKVILINSAQWQNNQRSLLEKIKRIGSTVVIKPNASGSSIGVQILKQRDLSARLITQPLNKYGDLVAQEYIAGKEITAPVLGNNDAQALPLIEIVPTVPDGTFYDYQAKYAAGGSEHIIPAPLPKKVYQHIQEVALQMHQLIGCRGVSRSDFILTKNNQAYYLETNTIPGMTSTSLLPQSAAAAGIAFPHLLDKIINLALN